MMLVLATAFLASCVEIDDTLLGIDLSWEPDETYYLDDIVNLDDFDIEILAEFETQTVNVSIDDGDVSVYGDGIVVDENGNIFLNTSELGTFTVTFAYREKTTSFTFTTVLSPQTVTSAVELAELEMTVFFDGYGDDAGQSGLTWNSVWGLFMAYETANELLDGFEEGVLKTELSGRLDTIIEQLSAVEELDMSGKTVPVNNMRLLAIFTNLVTLDISNVGIHDFWAFPELVNLETLIATDNTVPDLNLLPVLPNLTYLDVSNNNIIDVNGLMADNQPKFPLLDTLVISGNLVTDFEGLRLQTTLDTLIARRVNRLTQGNFDALFAYENLGTIAVLDIASNGLTELAFLVNGFDQLVHLDVSDNDLAYLDGIEFAPNLEVIDASGNVFVEGGLQNLIYTTKLDYLDISYTDISLPELSYTISNLINNPS
jgi:hypothetical protein